MLIHWFIYSICLFFAGAIFILYSQYTAFYLLALLIAAPVLSGLLFIAAVRLIKINIMPKAAVILCGSQNALIVNIKNNWILALIKMTLTIAELNRWQQKVSQMDISFNRRGQVVYEYNSTLCGKTIINIKTIKYYDIFGLFSYSKKYAVEQVILTMPKQITETDYYRNTQLYNVLQDKEKEFTEIKQYQLGDDIRHIHWPASARQDDIYIRQYTAQIAVGNKLVIFDNPLTEKFNNAMYEFFYEFAQFFLQKYNVFNWYYLGQDNEVYCRQIENRDGLNYEITAFMKNAGETADYIEHWSKISSDMPADCQQIIYITTTDNIRTKSLDKLYPSPQIIMMHDNDIEYIDNKIIYIDKNELVLSLTEVEGL